MRVYMIRHGQAAAGWDADLDPGLSDVGHEQAAKLIAAMAHHVAGPVPIISSPLRRCQETAQPLAQHWGQEIHIDPRVRELPSPSNDLNERGTWLRQAMAGTWTDLEADPNSQNVDFKAWRAGVLDAVQAHHDQPAIVIVSHFIAINVVYGQALGQDEIVCFRPDNTSITVFSVEDGGQVDCLIRGDEAQTQIN